MGEVRVPPMKTDPPCMNCTGLCCTNKSGWQFVHLTPAEQKHPVFAGKVETHEPTGQKGFAYVDGACPFFARDSGRCNIYKNRPKICREFDCRLHAPAQFWRLNPHMVDLVTAYEEQEFLPPLI